MPAPHELIVRRNYLLNVVEGSVFIASSSLTSAQTVLPALVVRLGGSNVAVGTLSVIVWVGLFLPQIFAARYVETLPWKKPWAVWTGMSQLLAVALMGFAVLLFGGSQPQVALWLFLVLYRLCQVLGGVATPGWFDLFAKVTPSDRRGRLIGIRTSIGGVGAFFFGLVLTFLLNTFNFPYSYACAFFIAFALQMTSLHFQRKLVEEEPSPVRERKPFFAYLKKLPEVLHGNRDFRNFIVATVFSILATMPVGFFTVYALDRFHATEVVVGEFTLTIVAIQVIGALVTGFIADRYGYKMSLVSAVASLLLASLCALLAPSLSWFRFVYVFLGINLGTEVMARYNMSIEYGPIEQRSTYIGLMNTVLAPFYLSGMVAGWLSDMFGYVALFGIGAVLSSIGLFLLVFVVRDPRELPRVGNGRIGVTTA